MKKENESQKVTAKPKPAASKKTARKKETADAGKKETNGRRRVVFSVEADPGSEVYVAGSFNGWSPKKHPMTEKAGPGSFERQIYAPPGPLEYKFVINGEWVIDARCSAWVPNALGSLNSLIEVR